MRLKDIKVTTQLITGLSIILVFVIVLGVVSFFQGANLWNETEGLYQHPLTVRRALGEIKADIYAMRLEIRNVAFAESNQELIDAIQDINILESDVLKQFDIVYSEYLGPADDIDTAYEHFIEWKVINDETIHLTQAGRIEEAIESTRPSGIERIKALELLDEIKIMEDFAKEKADEYFLSARNSSTASRIQLSIILGIILILSGVIIYFLMKNTREPLRELIVTTKKYEQGNMDARSSYISKNEFGELSSSFNTLAETMQGEIKNREDIAKLARVMLGESELKRFCTELLNSLMKQTNSQVGAVYLLDDKKKDYILFESIGLGEKNRKSFSAVNNEGEFGTALVTKKIQHITKIPPDTLLSFYSVSGDFKPTGILTIPILSGKEISVMVSLASIQKYSDRALQLVNDIYDIMTARFEGVLAFWRMQELADKLDSQNRQLETQSVEMLAQADELSEQNIELKQQKNQVSEANRLKDVFVSNMSHELRTPLNSIISLSSILNRKLLNSIPGEEHEYIGIIERNGKHLLNLINDLLDLSRIESGKEDINLSKFTVNELIETVVSIVKPQANEKNIKIFTSLPGELSSLVSDFAKCQHILMNIVANAVKFTKKGKVDISASQTGDRIHIVVKDTGIGIEQDKIHYIFDEFRQTDDSFNRKHEGTGLGLAIAQKNAKLLDGSIEVKSTFGKGSTFIIKLPLISRDKSTDISIEETEKFNVPYSSTGQTSAHFNKDSSILLVEDNNAAIIQITDILQEKNYRLSVARNGKKALEQVDKMIPDIILLDLMMPEIDGFEVLRELRKNKKTASIPVIVLTAKHISKKELSFLKGNKIFQLVQKGNINKDALLKAIESALLSENKKKNTQVSVRSTKSRITGKAKILIVEDNPDNMMTAKAVLGEGFHIFEAIDGKAGVEQAKSHKPDLILLDISLPVMDGFEVFDSIRKDKTMRHIPIIAVTASAMKGTKEEILAYGFDDYISKPIDEKLLKDAIGKVLNER